MMKDLKLEISEEQLVLAEDNHNVLSTLPGHCWSQFTSLSAAVAVRDCHYRSSNALLLSVIAPSFASSVLPFLTPKNLSENEPLLDVEQGSDKEQHLPSCELQKQHAAVSCALNSFDSRLQHSNANNRQIGRCGVRSIRQPSQKPCGAATAPFMFQPQSAPSSLSAAFGSFSASAADFAMITDPLCSPTTFNFGSAQQDGASVAGRSNPASAFVQNLMQRDLSASSFPSASPADGATPSVGLLMDQRPPIGFNVRVVNSSPRCSFADVDAIESKVDLTSGFDLQLSSKSFFEPEAKRTKFSNGSLDSFVGIFEDFPDVQFSIETD